jgi:hypothetical protein
MTDETMNLDNLEFYAIKVGQEDGIPAVEQDLSTGQYNVLIFTSYESASKYCYLRKPTHKDNIYKLDKKTENKRIIQTGLLRIARKCCVDYKYIGGVVFDHPGVSGKDTIYATMQAVALAARRLVPKESTNNIFEFLARADAEDNI